MRRPLLRACQRPRLTWVALSLAPLLAACAPVMVQNQPRVTLLGQSYEAGAVRDAVARAINRRHLNPTAEADGQITAIDTEHASRCGFTVQYTTSNLVISAMQPQAAPLESASPDQAPIQRIDRRCLQQADELARVITKEAERPAKLARRAEKERRAHELAVERERRRAEEAGALREQLAQQAVAAPPADVPPDGQADQPVEGQVAEGQPAEGVPVAGQEQSAPPAAVVYQQNNSTSTTTVNNRVTYNRVTAPPPTAAPVTPRSALLCCQQGRPLVCPNASVYAAACLRQPSKAAHLCRPDPTQARYCH